MAAHENNENQWNRMISWYFMYFISIEWNENHSFSWNDIKTSTLSSRQASCLSSFQLRVMEIAKLPWKRPSEWRLAIDHERIGMSKAALSKPARRSVLQNEGLRLTLSEFKQCLHEAAGRPIGRVEASYQSFRPCLNDERNYMKICSFSCNSWANLIKEIKLLAGP